MQKVVVIGLGRFGASVAERLYGQGAEVLAIDRNLKLVEALDDKVSAAIACDATVRANLEAYRVGNMDTAVIAIGNNFESSVLLTLHCKELGVPRIIAKALNPLQEKVLLELGADQVIMPEEEMGVRLAEHILHESVVDFVELPIGYSLRRIDIPADWVGKTLAELDQLREEKLMLIQVIRQPATDKDASPERIPMPSGDTLLQAADRLDVIGADKVLDRFA
jgi:trk system potassium uptake protein TrkA